jgi:hypothetical protein
MSFIHTITPSGVLVVSLSWDTGWTGRLWILKVSPRHNMKISPNQDQHIETGNRGIAGRLSGKVVLGSFSDLPPSAVDEMVEDDENTLCI